MLVKDFEKRRSENSRVLSPDLVKILESILWKLLHNVTNQKLNYVESKLSKVQIFFNKFGRDKSLDLWELKTTWFHDFKMNFSFNSEMTNLNYTFDRPILSSLSLIKIELASCCEQLKGKPNLFSKYSSTIRMFYYWNHWNSTYWSSI